MSISSIRPAMLLPERELIINKSLILKGNPVIFASVTEQGGVIKLWLFQQISDIFPVDEEAPSAERCITNRDELLRRIPKIRAGYVHFSEITIQGIHLPISQSAYGVIGNDPMNYMKVQHFVEAGVNLSALENIGFGYLVLSELQLADGSAFPEIDTNADIPISLRTQDEYAKVLVEPPQLFHLQIGEQPENTARSFFDQACGKDIPYYIDRVVCHDIWKQTKEQFNDETVLRTWRENGFDDTAIEQMKARLRESLEHICPEGHELLLLQYETPDNVQLNFYTTEFLESAPVHSNSGSSVGLIGMSDEDSVHGFPVRCEILKTVPAGFAGAVDVELVSWNRAIPGEWVKA